MITFIIAIAILAVIALLWIRGLINFLKWLGVRKMIKQSIRKILCRIDFWFYIHKGSPLTKMKWYREDVPDRYWGKKLVKDAEVAPYYLVFCKDPQEIKITDQDKRWAKKMWEERGGK